MRRLGYVAVWLLIPVVVVTGWLLTDRRAGKPKPPQAAPVDMTARTYRPSPSTLPRVSPACISVPDEVVREIERHLDGVGASARVQYAQAVKAGRWYFISGEVDGSALYEARSQIATWVKAGPLRLDGRPILSAEPVAEQWSSYPMWSEGRRSEPNFPVPEPEGRQSVECTDATARAAEAGVTDPAQ